jgi:hypothetical protein
LPLVDSFCLIRAFTAPWKSLDEEELYCARESVSDFGLATFFVWANLDFTVF